MVKTNHKTGYPRRYRTCFIIGVTIFISQILLAGFFLDLSKNNQEHEKWEPSDSERESGSNNEALNSARRSDEEETNLLAPQTKKTSNITLSKIEDINFELPCQITEKQALSALNRAKSQKCKQVIANASCLGVEDQLYPSQLESSCPSDGLVKGKEMGCFKDEKNFRLLNGYYGVNKVGNSPDYCIGLCLQSGFPYAGVQYSHECFCGSEEPPSSSKIQDSSCNMKCPGDSHDACGGYYSMNVFQTGIKKFTPQVAKDVIYTGKPVKIVFLLTLNGRALRQVKRLLKLIYNTEHYYYIHVDVRQDYLYRELLALEKFPNIRLTRRRFATIWGGASLLHMLRSCMHELLQTDWNWDFVLNLSESDFPVKQLAKLTSFLSANRGRNFVKSHGREVQRFIQKQGLDKTFVECDYRMWRIGNRKLPSGIQVDGGSDWIALSRPFVEYVADPKPDELVVGLIKVFSHTLLPAESFFHTTLRNSKFCDTYVDNNLHVTNWKRKLGCKCQYKHVVDWCGCSPNDFTPEDWSRILNTQSRALYFARKFEPIINQGIILQLELWLYGLDKPSKEVVNLKSYWQNIYHHQDLGGSFDDALYTFSRSVARLTLSAFSNKTSCDLSFITPLQIHTHHSNDRFQYGLFLFDTSLPGNPVIEVAVRLNYKTEVAKASPLMEHLQSLSVSSEYDQKEQVSRNFLKLLSSYSEPVAVYKFKPFKTSKQYNLTCLWVDPAGNLRDVSVLSVDENNLAGHSKPSGLKQPLLPGVWQLKVIYKESLLAQLSFPIFPLQYFAGQPVVTHQTSYLHSGLNQPSTVTDTYSKFLPNATVKLVLQEEAQQNSLKQDEALLNWIDRLFRKFYVVDKVCVDANAQVNVCHTRVNPCRTTSWSSLAPDPKSAIGEVNVTTGMFDVW